MGRKRKIAATALFAVPITMASLLPADAVDEIQLYNAEIAEVGQFTIQHHFNYTFDGRTTPEFPGGLVPNHALNATPEFAYGVTDWFEAGLYIPWAIDGDGQFLSNNFKLRTLFVMPNADKRDFFMGLNFEYDLPNPQFDPNRFAMEMRPIIGWRNPQWEFIVNPIFDAGFGSHTYLDFVPAARLARKLAEDTFVGVEYYTDLGLPGSFPLLYPTAASIVWRGRFQGRRDRCRFRRRLWAHAGLGPAGRQDDFELCVPGAGQIPIERACDAGAANHAQLAARGRDPAISRRPIQFLADRFAGMR